MGKGGKGEETLDQCKCANVQRWKGGRERSSLVGEWTSGLVGEEKKRQEAVERCKCVKVGR
ncbi:hypothetical protein EBR11_06120 [bacterium]|nr:hypothetical protein [bacterium]